MRSAAALCDTHLHASAAELYGASDKSDSLRSNLAALLGVSADSIRYEQQGCGVEEYKEKRSRLIWVILRREKKICTAEHF